MQGVSFLNFYTAANTGPPPGQTALAQELVHRPTPREGFALKGCILRPGEPLDPGYVEVGPSGSITAVTEKAPAHTRMIDTDGIILPGLIDLHNHPEYNVFPAWEPPTLFANRYQWRASDLYKQLIADPQDRLIPGLPRQTELRYSQVRALVGGVTAVQGASWRDAGSSPSLIRTVDQQIFGEHRGRAMVDLPSSDTGAGADQLRQILRDIEAGSANAFFVHLAEGTREDRESLSEFDRLVSFQALTEATIVIHGVAMTQSQLGDLRDAGGKLVWSPQSNLRLYGETTRAAEALEMGLPVAVGADWLPSGSPSLLAELRTAGRVLHAQHTPLAARDLVHMVTRGPARISGLAEMLGVLAPHRVADMVVLQRLHADPWQSVLLSDRANVQAVFLQGSLAYGEDCIADELDLIVDGTTRQFVIAWGRRMVLDTGTEPCPSGSQIPAPNLEQLRSEIIRLFPAVGPVFA
jgi:cytosine/adenosine deaminase-related metal-dependent hydrolase